MNGPIVAHGADELFRTDHLNTSRHPQPFHLELADLVKAWLSGAAEAPPGQARTLAQAGWLARGGMLARGSTDGASELSTVLLEIRPFSKGTLF